MEWTAGARRRSRLIHLDPRLPDHWNPACEIALDLGLELGRRIADRLHDLGGELRPQLRRIDRFDDLALNFREHYRRNPRRRDHPVPGVGLNIAAALLQ